METKRGKRLSGTDRLFALGWATLGATVVVGVGAIVATVRAQDAPQPPAAAPRPSAATGGFGQGGGFPGGPPAGFPGAGFGGARLGGGVPGALAASGNAVYVLRGNNLIWVQVERDSSGTPQMRVVDRLSLPDERPRPGGAGSGAGTPPAGGAGSGASPNQ